LGGLVVDSGSRADRRASQPVGLSNRAALFAVLVAFLVGVVGSLALRPASRVAARTEASGSAAPTLRWRLPVSFATNLPALGDNAPFVAERLRTASGGRIHLEVFEPGEVVPALGVAEAVSAGKVEAGYTWVGYEEGRIPASVLFGSVPFGMEPWEYLAWWYHGGGRALGEKVFAPHDVHPVLCGIVGPETAGWFREEITSLGDIDGLKIRFAGLGGKVLQRLGASVTMLAGGEIFQALDRGAIDASEYSLPSSDTLLGFDRIVSNNYFPGWHQPSTAAHLVVNRQEWEALSRRDQAMIENACGAGVSNSLAHAEAAQGPVLRSYPERGVQARALPTPLLRELERVANELLDDEAARDPLFAEVLAAQRAFRAEYAVWKSLGFLPRDF
jgi:TRAP-type mannitol/chloroaromatic compound transport system substrate-binding protein